MRKPIKRDTSPRFTDKPRDVFTSRPLYLDLPKPTAAVTETYAPGCKYQSFPAGKRSTTWRKRGGVTPRAHITMIAQAFRQA